jgi:hypothetical protein
MDMEEGVEMVLAMIGAAEMKILYAGTLTKETESAISTVKGVAMALVLEKEMPMEMAKTNCKLFFEFL